MAADAYPTTSEVREVGPRDGLQNEDPIPVEAQVELVDALSDTSLRAIEVGSFVRPDAIPAMAGTERVLAAIARRAGVRYRVLVPNLRGAELAIDAGADEIEVVVSVSETHNGHNLKMPVSGSVAAIGAIVEHAAGAGVLVVAAQRGVRRFDASVGGLGGCPFAPGATGNVPTEDVVHLLDSLGMATGVDLDRLIEVALRIEAVIGRRLPGQVMRAGPWYRLPAG